MAATFARRFVAGSRSGFRRPVASEFITSPNFFLAHAVHACGGLGVCASPVEAPSAVLPVVLWWSLPRVASGRPRGHCPAMPSRHAPGRMVSVFLFFYLSPLLSGHGYWPSGHD
jgi:hypothetical protein